MARPALSASRSVDVLDFLAAFPGRGFTLSEIARAAKINVASCHAVLSALVERGYLVRRSDQRTYVLGPALVAIGEAALKSQPLVARAKAAAQALSEEFALPVLLSAVVDKEILGVVSISDAAGRSAGLRVGERMPLVAPVGAPFLAWSSEATIEAWLDRAASPRNERLADDWRRTLALTRQRGFQVTLRAAEGPHIAEMMAEMAAGRRLSSYKDEAIGAISSLENLAQPETLEPDELYDIVLIAAPIFDQDGEAPFNLCLGGFAELVSGRAILDYADRLMRICLQVMRDDRTQP
jgi:DNA-binding IclR family transcriptional regulator